ncbi:MAG: DUF805 domain-containing protein [Hyphomicrobiaceae bacterium]
MSLKIFFFAFEGRITRRDWWLGMLALWAASAVYSLAVNPEAWFGHVGERIPVTAAEVVFGLAMLIPQTALNLKRLADRGWGEGAAYGFALMVVVMSLLISWGALEPLQAVPVSALDWIARGLFMAMSLFIIVEAGFRRGALDGSNMSSEIPTGAAISSGAP